MEEYLNSLDSATRAYWFGYTIENNLASKIKAAISSDLSYLPSNNPESECLVFFSSNQTPFPVTSRERDGYIFGDCAQNVVHKLCTKFYPYYTDNKDEELVKEHIAQLIEHLSQRYYFEILVQFWTPVTTTGRCYLATSDQPFGICGFNAGLCEFRKLSLDYKAYVDTGSTEKELGPIGRVFIKKTKELLKVELSCSSEECPHLDHALRCKVQIISAVPMFGSSGLIGVIEIVYGSGKKKSTNQSLTSSVCHDELEAVDPNSSFDSDHYQSLNDSSSQEMVEELYNEGVPSFIENNIDSFHIHQATKSPPRTKGLHINEGGTVQMDSSFHHLGVEDDVINNVIIVEERNMIGDVDSKKEGKIKSSKSAHRKTESSISYEVLEQHFEMKLKDAAEKLGTREARDRVDFMQILHFAVSRSTLKRQCRHHKISRWPTRRRKKVNHRPSSKPPPKQAITQASHMMKLCDAETEDDRIATIKATYKDDIIKFQLSFSSGVADLEEEVAKRLKLETGTFRVKYMDEDGDPILIACDEDLKNYMQSSTSLGITTLKVIVTLS